jgi:zona occludens toxin
MAIDAYTGLPGSGKSYSVVKFAILPSLKQGRLVITNIPLTELAHEEFPGLIRQLPHDWYRDEKLFETVPNGSVVVLDELWRRWPKGMPAAKVPFRDKEFLAEHRHLVDEEGNSTRIVLVTQDLDQIAAFATMLVDTTYQSVKLSALGSNKRFRVDIYQGAAKGQRPPKSRLLRSVYDTYQKQIHQYYQSATKSLTGQVGDESRADKRATIWRSPLMMFTLVSPVLIGLLVWQIGKFFANGMTFKEPEPEPVAEVVPAPAPIASTLTNPWPDDMQIEAQPVSAPPPEPARLSYSDVWRVVGHMRRSEPDTGKMADVVMLTSLSGVRYEPMANCEQISMGFNYQCEIDGRLATPWSGPINQNMAGYVLGGASETVNAGRQAVGLGTERSAGTEARTAQPSIAPTI